MPDEIFNDAQKRLVEQLENRIQQGGRVAAELDKTLISLSAGALVFSMTFVNTLAPQKFWLPVLFAAWTAFALSIVFVILAMRSEQRMVNGVIRRIGDECSTLEKTAAFIRSFHISPHVETSTITNPNIGRLDFAALLRFLLGVASLGCFVGYNLWNT